MLWVKLTMACSGCFVPKNTPLRTVGSGGKGLQFQLFCGHFHKLIYQSHIHNSHIDHKYDHLKDLGPNGLLKLDKTL